MITDVCQEAIFHKLFQEKSCECMYMYNYFKVYGTGLFQHTESQNMCIIICQAYLLHIHVYAL